MHKLKSNYIKLDYKNRLYNTSQPIIGLTGGIASGKSTVSNILKELEVPLIDADLLIKKIYQKEETKTFIQNIDKRLIKNEQIDFKSLRELFFSSEVHKKSIEQFLFKKLPEEFSNALNSCSFTQHNFIVYDAALLFEKNLHQFVDLTLLVSCSQSTQISRLVKRDGISTELANSIISQQMSLSKKKELADLILENDTSIEELKCNLLNLLGSITTS